MDAGGAKDLFPFTGHSDMLATDDETVALFDGAFATTFAKLFDSLLDRENQRFQSPGFVDNSVPPSRARTGQPDALADVAVGMALLSFDAISIC